MKTITTYILAASFVVSGIASFALTPKMSKKELKKEALEKIEISTLAPLTPEEATFEDVPESNIDLTTLSPKTPFEATFEDI